MLKSELAHYTDVGGKEGVIDRFFNVVNKWQFLIKKVVKETNIQLRSADGKSFTNDQLTRMRQSASKCWMCSNDFEEGDERVLDHDHYNGQLRGVAHDSCNKVLKKNSYNITVIIHNLRGYDSHLILQKIGAVIEEKNKNPNNKK